MFIAHIGKSVMYKIFWCSRKSEIIVKRYTYYDILLMLLKWYFKVFFANASEEKSESVSYVNVVSC